MKEIEEINKQIQELHNKRNKILEKQCIERVIDLKWTENCVARVEINDFYDYGRPKYKIIVYGYAPIIFKDIKVFGGDDYGKSVYYGPTAFGNCAFYIECSKTLIKFLNTVKFKEIKFDKDKYEILSEIKDIAEQNELGKISVEF